MTFFPRHFLGFAGRPRRIPNYPQAFEFFNRRATFGLVIASRSVLIFIYVFMCVEYSNRAFRGFTKQVAPVFNPLLANVDFSEDAK